jgi:hypothetical protein
MKKYNDEYFSVLDKKTGRKLLDCGDEQDALAMVAFDPQNRTITRNKFLMGPVVDIEIPKALPTSNVVASNVKENGCAPRREQLEDVGLIQLPQGQGEPVVV